MAKPMRRDELLERLRDCIRNGTRHSQIAAAGGVSERTVYHWFERSKGPRNPLVRAALEKFAKTKNGATR